MTPEPDNGAALRQEKLDALQGAIDRMEKTFGKGVVMRMGARPTEPVAVIPTGVAALDAALGVGGLPRGRIVEIFGPQACGKTSLALSVVIGCQRQRGNAVLIDTDHAFKGELAKAAGVDMARLFVSQPDHAEQALAVADILVGSGAVDLLVVDTVASMAPTPELMGQAMRKLTAVVGRTGCCCVFVNRLRDVADGFGGGGTATVGGNALKSFASVRIELSRRGPLVDEGRTVGMRVGAKVVKNKVAPPFRQCGFDIVYGEGIRNQEAA